MTHELLNGLSSDEAEQVLKLGTRLIVPSGAELFRLGDHADRLFLTERGRIRLTLPMQVRGREEDIFVEERSPGQTVGWSALIPPYRFTLTATAPLLEAEVIALPREALRESGGWV
jgi:CRP-like cAMP-binding protein